MSRYTDCN